MDYLERNRRVFDELKQAHLDLTEGNVIVETNYRRFINFGKFYSPTLSTEVHIGLKELYTDRQHYDTRVNDELMVIQKIAELFPHLVPELPLFYGLLRSRDTNEYRGIIVEDFSQNGKYRVDNIISEPRWHPKEIISAFPGVSIASDDLSHMGFWVGNGRRLGDFYPFGNVGELQHANPEEMTTIFDSLESYTVLDY
jgi:hypothetical protein